MRKRGMIEYTKAPFLLIPADEKHMLHYEYQLRKHIGNGYVMSEQSA